MHEIDVFNDETNKNRLRLTIRDAFGNFVRNGMLRRHRSNVTTQRA
jgi:hypothetical protein